MANKTYIVLEKKRVTFLVNEPGLPLVEEEGEIFIQADETEYTQKNAADSAAEALADADTGGTKRFIIQELNKQ